LDVETLCKGAKLLKGGVEEFTTVQIPQATVAIAATTAQPTNLLILGICIDLRTQDSTRASEAPRTKRRSA